MIPANPAQNVVSPPRRKVSSPLRRAVVTAPMRVSLAGGGSDLPPFLPGIGGRIVGTAIDLRVRALVEPFDRGWVRLELDAGGVAVTRRRSEPRDRAIGTRLLEEALALTGIADGVRLRIETSLIPGAGLGGSASAAVAALGALRASLGEAPAPAELAEDAVRVERVGLRLACGSQDQTFAAFGGLLDLRFDGGGIGSRASVDAPPGLLRDIEDGLLLVDTGRRRVSGEVIGRADYPPETTRELVEAAGDVARGFAEGALDQVLAGMRRGAVAKTARDPAANEPATAIAARLDGCGAEVVRMCGAGAGGHVLVWAPRARHAAVEAALDGCTVRRAAIRAEGVRIEA
jgi:D-glycero-alpha-D-manno-heptose-7-phosphate kinase